MRTFWTNKTITAPLPTGDLPVISVVGFLAMRQELRVPELPLKGVPTQALSDSYICGAGFHQALACAALVKCRLRDANEIRHFAVVSVSDAVGRDPHGREILRVLKHNQINCAGVEQLENWTTTTAFALQGPNGGVHTLATLDNNLGDSGPGMSSDEPLDREPDVLVLQPALLTRHFVRRAIDYAISEAIPVVLSTLDLVPLFPLD